MSEAQIPDGNVRVPTPSDTPGRLALGRLQGHSTSDAWLPAGVWPLLDELREEHLRLRAHVAEHVNALQALDAKWDREDKEYDQELQEAHRDHRPLHVEDRRAKPADRETTRRAIEALLSAGLKVLADHADRVIETVREHEDEWLADLRSRLAPAQEKRRRAEALLTEAKAEAFYLHKLGHWLQVTADDEALGRQPAPEFGPPPVQLSRHALEGNLERPWHKKRPWSRKG